MSIEIQDGRTVTVDGKAYKVLGIQGQDVHLEDENGGRHVKPMAEVIPAPVLTPAAKEPDVEVSDDTGRRDVPSAPGEAAEAEADAEAKENIVWGTEEGVTPKKPKAKPRLGAKK